MNMPIIATSMQIEKDLLERFGAKVLRLGGRKKSLVIMELMRQYLSDSELRTYVDSKVEKAIKSQRDV